MPPSNSSHTIWSSERNKHHLRIVATANICGMHTCSKYSGDGHHASTRAVRVVRVVSTADSRTERLCVLLTVSSNRYRLTHTYLIQPSLTKNGWRHCGTRWGQPCLVYRNTLLSIRVDAVVARNWCTDTGKADVSRLSKEINAALK